MHVERTGPLPVVLHWIPSRLPIIVWGRSCPWHLYYSLPKNDATAWINLRLYILPFNCYENWTIAFTPALRKFSLLGALWAPPQTLSTDYVFNVSCFQFLMFIIKSDTEWLRRWNNVRQIQKHFKCTCVQCARYKSREN